MTNLRECPFCGENASIGYFDSYLEWVVQCDKCRASIQFKISKVDAITDWNTRADGWISVSERLPKLANNAYDWFLVVIDYGLEKNVEMATFSPSTGWSGYSAKWDKNVTHWQTLPEGPK